MKLKISMLMIALLMTLLMTASVAFAADDGMRTATGSVGIETPLGSPDRPKDDSPMGLVNLKLSNLIGPIALFSGVKVNLREGLPWNSQNKFWVGLELPASSSGFVTYTYFERRWNVNDNRFVAGCRYNFRTAY